MTVWLWVGFSLLIFFLLALDLGVFHRKAHVVTLERALIFSGLWIGLALVFNLFLYFAYEHHWFGLDLPEGEPDGRAAAVLLDTLPGTKYYTLAGITICLGGGVIASIARARRTPESGAVQIPARRSLAVRHP